MLLSPPASAQEELLDLASSPTRVQVLVELEDAPAARVYGEVLRAAKVERAKSATGAAAARAKAEAVSAAKAQVARIVPAQERFLAAVSPALSPVEIFRVQRAMNAVALEVDASGVDDLRRAPGVRTVHFLELEYPTNSTSVPFLGTPSLWNDSLGLGLPADGTGITIGIIDTGIDYQHATFGGTGLLADYQANNRTVTDAFFPSAKVVGGFDFAGDNYNGTAATIAADPDPMDCNGHGTHVAGTAAGFGVNGAGTTFAGPYGPGAPFAGMRIGPGTAPRAQLYALRVFGCGGGTNLTVQAIDWAVDPNNDDDFSDHLDVINMSLGSNFGGANNTSSIAADNAALAGVIVVASAGNSGDTYFISGSPGVGGRVISTAGVMDSGLSANTMRVNAPAGVAGFYTVGTAAFGSVPPPGGVTGNVVIGLDAADAAGPLTTDGCSPLTNGAAVAGNIALIDRGTCGFAIKVKNAQDAGAIAVVVANSAAGVFGNMGGADPTITIASVMVTFADGNALRATIPGLNVTLFSAGDTVYTSSSRGPRRATSPIRLKPDIAAPGVSITSAQTGIVCTAVAPSTGCITSNATGFIADNQPLILTGTSMASPHMAGIMALLLQLHPDWSVEQLKALAMNRAIHDVTVFPEGGGARFGPGRVGSGRVDPPASAQATVLALNSDDSGLVSVSFEQRGILGSTTQVKRVRLVNTGATAATFDLGIDTVVDAPGVAFSLPGGNTVTIPAGDAVEIDVQMDANSTLMDHARDASVSATQTAPASPASVASLGTLNRHWLTEEGGYLTFSQGGNLRMRVALYSAPWPASAIAAPDAIATGGNPTGATTIPLAGSDVCTGTLGAGPTCTGTFPADEVSLVTPFELQVVSPPDPVAAPAFADLQYAGVAYSAATDQLLFGVSTWGAWSSPTEVAFNIYIDCGVYTNGASFAADTCNGVPDGNWDIILFNSNPGSLAGLFGVSASPQDSFLTAVFVRSRNSVVFGPANFVNRVSAGAVDSRLFDNQVMFLAADRTRLKINSTTGAFQYQIRTCPGTSPLCLALNGFRFDEAAGPFSWNYLAANQGLDFGGANLFFDLNGASLPVTWNTANMTANGSLGALLLHHHNEEGNRAEVLVLQGTATADLALAKSVDVPNPAFGQNVTFTLQVTNNGPGAATGVVVNDFLPAGLVRVSDNSGGAYNPATGLWTIGNLAASGTATLQIVATVETSDPVCNVAQVGASSPVDTNPSNNLSEVCVLAPRSADLALTMSVSSPTVLVGGSLTYTLTVTNEGDSETAYAVNVQEAFPAQPLLNPTSFTASQGVYNPATGLWNLAALNPGGTATLAITVTAPNMAGPLTNNGLASADTSDPDNADNTASATATVLSPATVTATKTVAGTFNEGGTVTYTVVLTNSGTNDQQNNSGPELTDVLPPSLTLVSASATAGSATATVATNTVTWDGVVPAGGSVTITINATINPGTAFTTITNQASVAFDADGNGVNEAAATTDDPGAGGATDPTAFVVSSPATLGSTKTVTGTFAPGGTVTYTVTIVNTSGAAQANNPGDEFVDTLPSQLVLLNATASSGTAVPNLATNTVTWNGSIAPSGSVTVTITARISDTAGGQTITNQGTVNFDADGNGSNESSVPTDNPALPGATDPTSFQAASAAEIPTLGEIGLAMLVALMAGGALLRLRRRTV